jgi:hypothetical protein
MLTKKQIVDRTKRVYAGAVPAPVSDGKQAVLGVLGKQASSVKSVEFLENFNVSPVETAIAGSPRYCGVVVSLSPDYVLSPQDKVWLNGPYSETLSVFAVSDGKFQALDDRMMSPDDSSAVCGIYERSVQDHLTGESSTQRYCVVNASAGDLSRDIVNGWAAQGLTVRDAYEKAATEELSAEVDSETGENAAPVEFDNMKKFITHITSEMAGTMGACGDASPMQVTNTFVRAAQGVVHYLNGAVAPSTAQGALCHVSPLHGYVRFPAVSTRQFYPASLLSPDTYVDVTSMSDAQRISVFSRASWNGNAHTTVNPFALRKPIQGWQKALPHPTQVFRMHKANFALDPREVAQLPPAAVLAMTPAKEHVATATNLRFPRHTSENRVQLLDSDNLIAQLVSMRGSFDIINPEYLKTSTDAEGVTRTRLELPRHIVEQLN